MRTFNTIVIGVAATNFAIQGNWWAAIWAVLAWCWMMAAVTALNKFKEIRDAAERWQELSAQAEQAFRNAGYASGRLDTLEEIKGKHRT